jgi:hypothetical protein
VRTLKSVTRQTADMREWSRRRYLRSFLAGSAAGVAGCSQVPESPLSGDTRTETYLDWLPAPSTLDTDPYATNLVRHVEALEHAEEIHPATKRVAGRRWVPFHPRLADALGDARTLLEVVEGTAVYSGVPAEDPVASLAELGYHRDGTRGDFAILVWDRLESDLEFAPETVAVKDDALVAALTDFDRAGLDAVVDAYRGAVPRLHEEVPRVRSVAASVGERTFTTMDAAPDRERPAGVVAVASGWRLDGDVAGLRMAVEFEDDADARVADVRGTIGGQWLRECRDVAVRRDGATVELSASIAIGRFDFRHAGTPGEDGIPDAAFALERDLADAVATHAGDQPVPAAELEVALYTGVRLESRELTRSLTDRQFDDVYDVVRQGDSMAFRPETNGRVQVEWVHPEADDRLALAATWFDA